ncbi:MAG: hypothetical protein M3R36_08810 [Bacteroidota bacterium]|nr:hypothetical protein [Bacteroidota bacterium]
MSDNNINSDAESQDQPETSLNKSEKEDKDEIISGHTEKESSSKEENSTDKSSGQETPSHKIIPVKPKDGNYQISLINKYLLKVLVLTNGGVKINSTVIEKKTSAETQSNEIYLNPKPDFGMQEVEIMIEVEEKNAGNKIKENISDNISANIPDNISVNADFAADEKKDSVGESIFKFDTINENLLKIKIITSEGVKIDSIARDKKISVQTQSNRIYLQPKSEDEIQEVDITISIESKKKEIKEDAFEKTDDIKFKFIPNPEVSDLIQPPDYSSLHLPDPYSTENNLDSGRGIKNPFDALRNLIRKNLVIGIIAAVILHLAAAAFAFYNISKKQKPLEPEEQGRLIVIQDLPDPKIKLENVEDPNKPKVEENPIVNEPDIIEPKREVTPRRIRPPTVTRPKREQEEEDVKLDSSIDANLTRELDSIRRLLTENPGSDTTLADSTGDSTMSVFDIADSLKNNFSENDIGLAMYYPKNWKLIDVRDIDKKEKIFKGLIITDTTASQPGTMNLFVSLDPEGKEFKSEDFKTEFKMNDSTLRAYLMEPKASAGSVSYKFYIFNNLATEKLLINAQIRQQFFDQYKNEIEAVVRSIRIRKKEDL